MPTPPHTSPQPIALLQEPFGLTLIEAAAHGVPIVATTQGGPVDIVHTLGNGVLVEPTDIGKVIEAIISISEWLGKERY